MRCASKSLTAAQKNYSTSELECLAIIWAIQKGSYYLLGQQNFTELTDHKPIKDIFGKDLYYLQSPRLQCLREKVAAYSFTVEWSPDKIYLIANTLSRSPFFSPAEMLNLDIDTAVTCMTDTRDLALDIILDAIDSDYRALIKEQHFQISLLQTSTIRKR